MDKVTELLISNLIGLFIGLGTSFFSWWVLYHKIVPEVKFADFISKIPKKSLPGYRYRIKFKNIGKRAILDVHVIARLVVDWNGSAVWTAYYVRLSVTGDKRYEMPKIEIRDTRVLDLYPELTTELLQSVYFPKELLPNEAKGELTLEDALGLKERAQLKVYVFGYDEFSGTRKVFESKYFKLADVKEGGFEGLNFSPAPENIADPGTELLPSNHSVEPTATGKPVSAAHLERVCRAWHRTDGVQVPVPGLSRAEG